MSRSFFQDHEETFSRDIEPAWPMYARSSRGHSAPGGQETRRVVHRGSCCRPVPGTRRWAPRQPRKRARRPEKQCLTYLGYIWCDIICGKNPCIVLSNTDAGAPHLLVDSGPNDALTASVEIRDAILARLFISLHRGTTKYRPHPQQNMGAARIRSQG